MEPQEELVNKRTQKNQNIVEAKEEKREFLPSSQPNKG